jgi:hypothetical protein
VEGSTDLKQTSSRPQTSPQLSGPTDRSKGSGNEDATNIKTVVGEREELREILRLAMNGFKLVGSVFANQKAKNAREGRRPATEPSGLGRGQGSSTASFPGEGGFGGRTYGWDGLIDASSPGGRSAGEAATSTGIGGPPAPSIGISSCSASTTPVAQANLTPNMGSNDLPHRAPSGLSLKSTTLDSDMPLSSPLEDGTGDRSGPVGNNNSNGQAVTNPVCLGCGATETPEWRRGPMGPRTLCNACGLVFAKLVSDESSRESVRAGSESDPVRALASQVRRRAREAAKAQAIAKGLLPPKKARSSKKAKLSVAVEKTKG